MQLKIISYPSQTDNLITNSVLVGGCFDLLHYGHYSFLKSAALHGSVIVALESDTTIITQKKNAPIHTQQQRGEILSELICVAQVICLPPLYTYEDYLTLVKWANPSVLAITQGDSQTENKHRQAREIGAKVVVVNTLISGLSSSIIRATHL